LGGFDVEIIFIIGIIIIVAFVGFELLEGVWALNAFDGGDEEWMAPLAIFSLLVFLAGLSYFG
tara:strand:- start:188 stop:376 length:189 start_codon:yes stop_codon:yes gene_type:complete